MSGAMSKVRKPAGAEPAGAAGTRPGSAVARAPAFANVREDVRRYIMTVGYGLSSVTSAAAPTE